MQTAIRNKLIALIAYARRNRGLVAGAAMIAAIPALLMAAAYGTIQPYASYVYKPDDAAALAVRQPKAGIVLGAGITKDGKPYRELQSRLDVAADALDAGVVDKLVLSGDNRFEHYNEPAAMKRYLVEEKGIAADKLQEDFAGRSTYESCERAAKVFQLDSAVLISARSHLPRAVYLCRQFGVESYGIASPAEANNQLRREALARVKAVMNVYVYGEKTILGAPIPL